MTPQTSEELIAFSTIMLYCVIAIAIISFSINRNGGTQMIKTISGQDLQQRINSCNPPALLEALPERYYTQQHLPGARLFPHDQVEQNAPRIVPDKGAQIVVYCASRTCQNSHIAARHLERLGYVDVTVYEGGKQDWEQSGFSFETTVQGAAVV
jgi:rhodanese-related sulfurtransferase